MKHTKHRLSFEPVFFCALLIEQFEEEKGDTHVLPDSIHPRAAPCSARTRPEGISQNIEIRRINRSVRRWTKGVLAFFFLVLTKYEKYLRISHSFRFKKRMTFFTTAINTLQPVDTEPFDFHYDVGADHLHLHHHLWTHD